MVKAGQSISRAGVRKLGYSGVDVVWYLGVTNSCVTRLISAGRKRETDGMELEL